MKLLKNMKISKKLFTGFSVLIILNLILISLAISEIRTLVAQSEIVLNKISLPMGDLTQMMEAYNRMRVNMIEVLIVKNKTEMIDRVKEREKEMRESFSKLKETLLTQEGKELTVQLEKNLAEFMLIRDKMFELAFQKKNEEAYDLISLKNSKVRTEIIRLFDRFKETKMDYAKKTYLKEKEAADKEILLMIILVVIATLFSVLIAVLIARSIKKPLQNFMLQFDKGSNGDLTARAQADSKDEIGELGKSLNNFMESLNEIMVKIANNNNQLLAAVSEVSQGNQDLAQRVDSQSASLEETASAIEEMTANIKNSAENVGLSSRMANDTKVSAFEGEKVLKAAVDSIQSTTVKAAKIRDIIKIIEGIAFQTNILALNAAVEAARAKEHGKGFAVVANEVRNLAQKSAENAKQISEVIEEMVRGIEDGNRLVMNSQEKFGDIKGKIEKAVDKINEVSAAFEEQSGGIDQINQAVSHLDEITQANASLVEELASTTEELEGQAREVTDTIKFFKLEDSYSDNDSSYHSREEEKTDTVLFKWDDKYSVHLNEMDSHHKKLFQIINKLFDSLKQRKSRDLLGTIVSELIEYTKFHFGAEERIMKQYNYPEYDEQKTQHAKFIEKIEGAKRDFDNGKSTAISTDLMIFLKDWLLKHILVIDKKYSDFFNERGLK